MPSDESELRRKGGGVTGRLEGRHAKRRKRVKDRVPALQTLNARDPKDDELPNEVLLSHLERGLHSRLQKSMGMCVSCCGSSVQCTTLCQDS